MEDATSLGWWGVVIAVLGGAVRVSTPYLFVSLGETITEKSGRINIGLEGTLVMGAMSGYGTAVLTGSPWLGVLVAGLAGSVLGLVHALVCNLQRVNDIAVGIALFIFGTGLAIFFGKPFIQPSAPRLPHLGLGTWSDVPAIRVALEINSLFIVGLLFAPLLYWGLKNTKWGLIVRTTGDSADAALALGYSIKFVRTMSTMAGGFFGRCRRLLSITLLSGNLERVPIKRPRPHGRRPGHLRQVEPDLLFFRVPVVRRRHGPWTGSAIGRNHGKLLSLRRRALHSHPGLVGLQFFDKTRPARRAERVDD